MTIVNSLSTLEFTTPVAPIPATNAQEDGTNRHPVPGDPEPTSSELRETSLSPIQPCHSYNPGSRSALVEPGPGTWRTRGLCVAAPRQTCPPTASVNPAPCHVLTIPPANAIHVKWEGPACGLFHCLNEKPGLFMKIKCLRMDCPILHNLGAHQPPSEHSSVP